VSQGSPNATKRSDNENTGWRGWESPRTGHYYDLQGPDADAVNMPAAPELGSEELIVEMAEVYALALLRDVSFTDIEKAAAGQSVDPTITGQSVTDILSEVSKLDWFSTAAADHSLQEKRRRAARKRDHGPDFDISNPPDTADFDPTNSPAPQTNRMPSGTRTRVNSYYQWPLPKAHLCIRVMVQVMPL